MFWSFIRKHIKTVLKIRDEDDIRFLEDRTSSSVCYTPIYIKYRVLPSLNIIVKRFKTIPQKDESLKINYKGK